MKIADGSGLQNLSISEGETRHEKGRLLPVRGAVYCAVPDDSRAGGGKRGRTCPVIRGNAFGGVECLSEVLLPDTLRVIGSQAFGFCWSPDSLTIPDIVTEIGAFAFSGCSALTGLHIPDTVTKIGDYAFSYCSLLKELPIPDSVQFIGEHAFEFCSEDLVIICGPDSCAKTYCQQNGIACKAE